MGPKHQDFQVYCNMETKETCFLGNKSTPSLSYSSKNGTFWLSEAGVDIMDIYNVSKIKIYINNNNPYLLIIITHI